MPFLLFDYIVRPFYALLVIRLYRSAFLYPSYYSIMQFSLFIPFLIFDYAVQPSSLLPPPSFSFASFSQSQTFLSF